MTQQSETDMDLRTRVVRTEHDLTDHNRRISDLEKWRQTNEINDACKEEQLKGMETRFDARSSSIEKSITSINGTLSRVMWLVLSGIIMEIVAFFDQRRFQGAVIGRVGSVFGAAPRKCEPRPHLVRLGVQSRHLMDRI